jgi:hypothetical protein
MKNKCLLLMVPMILLAVIICTVPAVANQIVVTGDQLLFKGQIPGHSIDGGVFWFTDVTQNFDFYTYCLEINEGINSNNYYWAVVNTGAINGGLPAPGFDPLDPKTAWVYKQWLLGNLSSYSQTAIQEAIWYFENEQALTPAATPLVAAVNALNPAPAGLYGVEVLNLWRDRTWSTPAGAPAQWVYSGAAQDVLFQPVPEPATILLLGLGLTGIGLVARKRAK